MQTIGERLEEARKRKGISIREAAEATKIRGDYLQKFENNQFDINLSDIYVRGFLRTYSNFLKLPPERIIADLKLPGTATEVKPKTPSREVYGRMDLSIASSGGKVAKDSGPAAGTPLGEAEEDSGTKRTFARIGTSLPTGTFVDQRVVIKASLIVFAAIVIGLLVWGVVSLASGGSSSRTSAMMTEPTITLIALDNVQVKVVQKADGVELFQGSLARGEQRTVIKRGPLYITAKEGRHLKVEINGKEYAMPFQGHDRCELP